MLFVGIWEWSSFAVFEIFLGGLIAADVGIVCDFGDIAEILVFVDKYFAVFVWQIFNDIRAGDGISGNDLIYFWRLKKMKRPEFGAQRDKRLETFCVFRVRHAREINF